MMQEQLPEALPSKRYSLSPALNVALFGLCYYAAAWLGLILSRLDSHYTLFWPPCGLFLVAFLRMQPKYWPALTVAATLASLAYDLEQGTSWLLTLEFVFANILTVTTGAILIRRYCVDPFELSSMRFVILGLVLFGATVSATLGACVGALALCNAAHSFENFTNYWLGWWLASVLGVILIAPAGLTFRWTKFFSHCRSRIEAVVLTAAAIAYGVYILSPSAFNFGAMHYLIVPCLVWSAIRFGPRSTAWLSLYFGLVIVWADNHKINLLQDSGVLNDNSTARSLQLFLLVIVSTALILAATQAEQKRVAMQLQESEQKFRSLFESSKDAILVLTENGFTDCNFATLEMFKLARKQEFLKTQPYDYSPPFQPDGSASHSAALEKIQTAQTKGHASFEWTHRRQNGEDFQAEVTLVAIEYEGKKIIQATVRDISERKRAEEALLKSEASLKEAARQKDNFLAMLGHELRNPLAPIRNAAQILKMIGLPNPSAEKARDMVERQTHHLCHIVDDLLDVSRITRGKVLLKAERLDLAKLVHDNVEDTRTEIETRGITLKSVTPSEPLWIQGDVTRLAQVLSNLLVNAQKFSDSGGIITVTLLVNPQTHQAELSVMDTGMGISPEVQAHLFEPFMQAEVELDRKRGGLGLGLALSKGLLELHGGTIRVESKGLKQGTTVTVCLPVLVLHPIAKPVDAAFRQAVPEPMTDTKLNPI